MEYITLPEWAEKNNLDFKRVFDWARKGKLKKHVKRKVFKVTKYVIPADLKASDVPDGRKTRWQKDAGKPL